VVSLGKGAVKGDSKGFKAFIAAIENNERAVCLAIVAVFSAYILAAGYVSTLPLTATYDPAMHAEIADPVIATQIYPLSWSPLADTGYTYPPLFHWVAFFISRLGFEPFAVVVTLGLALYAAFPLCLYLLGSLWGRKTALVSAIAGASMTGWSLVFLAGEYPQLLAMDLAAVFLYFYLKKDYPKAGASLGLVALSHPFVPVYLAIFVLINLAADVARKNKAACVFSLKCLAVSMVVTSVWLPQYLEIVQNATAHRWENVKWYYRPGLIGPDEINSFFFSFSEWGRINPAVFFLSLAGAGFVIAGFTKSKRKGKGSPVFRGGERLLFLFLFTLVFSVFHIPGTQYKFPDMLSLVIPPMSAFGLMHVHGKLRKSEAARGLLAVSVAFVFLFSAFNVGLINIHFSSHKQKYVSSEAAKEAALWLRSYDPEYSRILKTGDDEVYFSVLSHKYAMDPMITALEVLTEGTKEQLREREALVESIEKGASVSDAARKYGIKYVITEGAGDIPADGRLIYDKNGVRICELIASAG
jgi:hypothetical protein